MQADLVLLFRYSALTFNGHRIHYDRRYLTEVEGYPGLIVHGPLIATLLVDLLRRNVEAPLTRFAFRAVRPLFDIAPFAVCGAPSAGGEGATVWLQDPEGYLARETVQNLGGLTLLAGRGTLADADLVHLNGAIGSGQLHRDPPPHLAPGLLGWRLSVAPPRFWTVS